MVILFILHGGWQPYYLSESDVENVHCKELIEKPSWRRVCNLHLHIFIYIYSIYFTLFFFVCFQNKVYFDKLLKRGDKYLQSHIADLKDDYCVSDNLCNLLQNMLHFDVDKRFTAQQIMHHEWLNDI